MDVGVAPRIIGMHDASYGFETPMSLHYKLAAVRREGRIPQLLAQHSFISFQGTGW